jgi:hypothetical protein
MPDARTGAARGHRKAEMAIFLGILSAILGVMTVIQWIVGYFTGNSLRAKAQASYSQWAQVATLAEQIQNNPEKAGELAATINGMARAVRSEIVAYSRERLDFVPVAEDPWGPHSDIARPRTLWSKIRLGFSIK